MAAIVIETLNRRIASRAIATDALSEETVAELTEAVRLTPSCFNNQPWRFVFATSDSARTAAAEAFLPGNKPWAERAPLIVVGYSKKDDDCKLPDGRVYYQFDLGMSVMNLILAATENGLVARPMAGFKPAAVKEAFDLAEADEPLVMLAIGHPSDDESHLPEEKRGLGEKPRERKPAAEIIRRL